MRRKHSYTFLFTCFSLSAAVSAIFLLHLQFCHPFRFQSCCSFVLQLLRCCIHLVPRRILNALMTTDVASTLNWKGKGDKKSFEALNVCSIVKGKSNSLTNLLLFESLYLYKTCKVDLISVETIARSVKNLIKPAPFKECFRQWKPC